MKHGLWKEIKEKLEISILKDEYDEGEKLPTLIEMTQKFKCGRSTAQRVWSELEKENIIYRDAPFGVYLKFGAKQLLKDKYLQYVDKQIYDCIRLARNINLSNEEICELVNVRMTKED